MYAIRYISEQKEITTDLTKDLENLLFGGKKLLSKIDAILPVYLGETMKDAKGKK